jgi:hypothetical protein
MAYSGHSEEKIRLILAHSNVQTTKIYLRERHGFSGSFGIMKRFLERKRKKGYYHEQFSSIRRQGI